MELEKTGQILWITGADDTGPMPLEDVSSLVPDIRQELTQEQRERLADDLASFLGMDEGDINPDDIEVYQSYGARLSAPGYLDCTDWYTDKTEQALAGQVADYLGRCYECDRDLESGEGMPVQVSESGDAYTQSGALVDPDTYSGSEPIERTFCVASCKGCARLDQTILGSHWEIARDVAEAYTILNAPDIDALMDRLEAEGYSPEEI